MSIAYLSLIIISLLLPSHSYALTSFFDFRLLQHLRHDTKRVVSYLWCLYVTPWSSMHQVYPWSYLARLLHNSLKATVRLRATLLHVHVHPPHMCEEWTCTTYMSIPHTKSICHVHCTWQMLFRASQPKEARDHLCLFCCSFKKEIKISNLKSQHPADV